MKHLCREGELLNNSLSTMGLPWESIGRRLSAMFFLALFPLFFFYHYAIASGLMSAVAGGWFGVVSLLGAILFLPFWFRCLARLRQDALIFVFITGIFFSLVGSWLVIHYLFGSAFQSRQDVVEQVGGVLIQWFTILMIGLYWPENSPRFQVALWVSLVLMAVIIITHLNMSNLMFDARRFWGISEGVATYQGFARSLAFTGFALLAINQSPLRQLLLIGTLCILLFLCGARAEFLGFLLIMPLVLWVGFRRFRGWLVVAAFVVMLGVIVAAANLDTLSSSRQFQFLNPETWSSYQARQTLLESGVIGILGSPIFGDYAGHVRDSGGTGSYIHNMLSAWRQFGLLTFLLYVGLILISLWIAYRSVIHHRQNSWITYMALYINAFCLLMVIAATSVFWAPVALGWGLAVAVLIRTKRGTLGVSN